MRKKETWIALNEVKNKMICGDIQEIAEETGYTLSTIYNFHHLEKTTKKGWHFKKVIPNYVYYKNGEREDESTDLYMLCQYNGMDYTTTRDKRIGKEIQIEYIEV